MVIIFYDSDKEQIFVCTEREKMKIIPIDDPDLLTHIPNDDILYVQNAHFITKKQLGEWLDGSGEDLNDPNKFSEISEKTTTPDDNDSRYINSKFLHPVHNGAVLMSDIKTPKYPNGVELVGKYSFVSVDDLGGFDALEESSHYNYLLGKGKIEVVDYDYVKKNYNKNKTTSASDAALDRILIKGDAHGTAESVAASGGMGTTMNISGSDPIEIFVRGN